MGKKLQICILTIIALVTFLLLGGVICNLVRATNEDVIHPEVTFEIENVGTIKMELYQEYAPNTVANIVKLVEAGYYNNKVIYGKDELCLYVGRTQEGEAENPTVSLINSKVEAGSEADFEYSIEGEFTTNGFTQNTLRHEKGVVSLIRNNYGSSLYEESYNSGNAQLGVMMSDNASNLNGAYAAFGKITEGLDLLENIYNTQELIVEVDEETGEVVESTGGIEEFSNKLVITSATVDTHGVEFEIPEVIEAFDYEEYMYQMIYSQYAS